jgi:hypothetical protein
LRLIPDVQGEASTHVSGVLAASCHILLFDATSDHVSAVSASGSHFFIAWIDPLRMAAPAAPLNCTRLHVAANALTGVHVAAKMMLTTASPDPDKAGSAALLPSRTRSPADAVETAAVTPPALSRTRSPANDPDATHAATDAQSTTVSAVLAVDAVADITPAASTTMPAAADAAEPADTSAAAGFTRSAPADAVEAVAITAAASIIDPSSP